MVKRYMKMRQQKRGGERSGKYSTAGTEEKSDEGGKEG